MSALLDKKRVIYRKTARSALFHLLLSARNKLGLNKESINLDFNKIVLISVLKISF